MANPIRLDQIRAADWQPELGSLGDVVVGEEDVRQCIGTILTTPKGSVPHRPDFGSEVWRYVDWPLQAARPHIVRETVEAITRWEPRVEVTRVVVDQDGAQVLVGVTGRLKSGREITADVRVGG